MGRHILTFLIILIFVVSNAVAQECSPPKIVFNDNKNNIFTEEQEMILGELTFQRFSADFRPIRDPELNKFLDELGAKLVRHLPPTSLQFKFHIVDYPSANAFNIPGGHVFVTRKLIAFANSEDELAFVIGHELGHAIVRHGAQDLSQSMIRVLNVRSVGDRRDITEKYNRLIENVRTRPSTRSNNHEGEQQLEADRVGFFAAVAAGYDPTSAFTFFDRLTESGGKKGNWFSDLFGTIKPAEKRLREIAKATSNLPATCRDGRSPRADQDFQAWQAAALNFRRTQRAATVPGLLRKQELTPKLRTDVSILEFSKDGNHLLAVDDFAVTVVARETLKPVFQVPADNVEKAHFTPDGKQVVFLTRDLRFERWDVATGKPALIREVNLRRSCYEYDLTPTGDHIVCIDTSVSIRVISTNTGNVAWEKKEFYPLNSFEYFVWLGARNYGDDSIKHSFFRVGFSPDSRFALLSRSNKYLISIRVDGITAVASENAAVALDLTTMKETKVGGDIKKIAARPYTFVDNDRIVGNPDGKLESGGIFSFPEGKRIHKMEFGGEKVEATANPQFVTIKPMTNSKLGIYDLRRREIVTGLNKNDVAIWNDIMAMESVNGNIIFRKIGYEGDKVVLEDKNIASFELPVGPVKSLRGLDISDDQRWITVSTATRGALWDLKEGKRTMFVRSFRDAVVDNAGNAVAEFTPFDDSGRTQMLMRSDNGQATMLREMPRNGSNQHGRFMLTRTKLPSAKPVNVPQNLGLTDDQKEMFALGADVKLEIFDWIQNKSIWSAEFKGPVPRYSFHAYSGRLILYWNLNSETGKARVNADPKLKAAADSLGTKDGDQMIEVIDAYDQTKNGRIFVETGNASFRLRSAISERDWVAVYDSEGRVLLYSLSTGQLMHRFFGIFAALCPKTATVAIETLPGELAIYDLNTGDKKADLEFDSELTFMKFNIDGTRLFVLTESQTTYTIDMKKMLEGQNTIIP